MVLLIASALWVALVAWLLYRAVRQFQTYHQIDDTIAPLADTPAITVVIPARDEADNIARCIQPLLAQSYPKEKLDIVVIDDNSSDETPAIVRDIAKTDPRVRLIHGRSLPSTWAGKPFACWQGAQASEAPWLCFLDADTAANSELLSSAMHTAIDHGLDMLSLEPFQELGSFWERLVTPAGFFMIAITQDLGRVNDPDRPEAVANGQFILIRRDVYDAVGGHAAVRDEICEDSALARAVKDAGHRLAVLGAESLLRTRMYTGLHSLWEGISKNITEIVGSIPFTILIAIAAIAMATLSVVLPVHALVLWLYSPTPVHLWSLALSFAGSLALFATHVMAARHFRIPFWYGLLFPIAYVVGALIAVDGSRQRLQGHVQWKGRTYAPPAHP